MATCPADHSVECLYHVVPRMQKGTDTHLLQSSFSLHDSIVRLQLGLSPSGFLADLVPDKMSQTQVMVGVSGAAQKQTSNRPRACTLYEYGKLNGTVGSLYDSSFECEANSLPRTAPLNTICTWGHNTLPYHATNVIKTTDCIAS